MALTKIITDGITDDAVTEAKLANAINTAVAANTAKDLTALSAANLTSGTVPDARFPATLPAASAANLTAVPAANITGTLPAISAANLTNVPAANITGTLPAISATNLTNIPAANITGTLPAISGANLTGISTTQAASTPSVGGSSSINHTVASNLTYTNVTGNYLLGNVNSALSASTIYGIIAYVELHHHSSSASHGYLTGWLYQTGKTYNVDGAYFALNMYNAYSTALRFGYAMPWDPSGTQSLSLYIATSLETGTNNYFNIGVMNKLENV
tara:strand:- start:389 stop:1207 length:819 start_codon:yes stop_codon:yes gene_type:complete